MCRPPLRVHLFYRDGAPAHVRMMHVHACTPNLSILQALLEAVCWQDGAAVLLISKGSYECRRGGDGTALRCMLVVCWCMPFAAGLAAMHVSLNRLLVPCVSLSKERQACLLSAWWGLPANATPCRCPLLRRMWRSHSTICRLPKAPACTQRMNHAT